MNQPGHKVSNPEPAKVNLLDLNRAGLQQFFTDLGEKPFRVRQVMPWIYHRQQRDFSAMTDLSRQLREQLELKACIKLPEVALDRLSADGTNKWLFRLHDGNSIETVFIPEDNRGTLCVSSQVGCALDCSFCATGRQGFNRNLSTAEIIAQVWLAGHLLANNPKTAHRRVTNIVMMGMGEPLHNYDHVRDAMNVFSDGDGLSLSKRRITLSTSGVVPNIIKIGEETGAMLAISLHAVNDELRDVLVPINKKYPLEELLEACRNYPGLSNARRITFEYVMLDGVNDTLNDAKELVRLLAGIPAKINLIPFNPWPGSPYKCSDWEQIEAFADIVNRAGYASPVRTPRGRDIMAACGQLKSLSQKLRASDPALAKLQGID